jgi:hypothetical protein
VVDEIGQGAGEGADDGCAAAEGVEGGNAEVLGGAGGGEEVGVGKFVDGLRARQGGGKGGGCRDAQLAYPGPDRGQFRAVADDLEP